MLNSPRCGGEVETLPVPALKFNRDSDDGPPAGQRAVPREPEKVPAELAARYVAGAFAPALVYSAMRPGQSHHSNEPKKSAGTRRLPVRIAAMDRRRAAGTAAGDLRSAASAGAAPWAVCGPGRVLSRRSTRRCERVARVRRYHGAERAADLAMSPVVGYMQLVVGRSFVCVQHLVVAERVQRRGVGTELVNLARLHLQPFVRPVIFADVDELNLGVQLFFRRFGFGGRSHDGARLRFEYRLGPGADGPRGVT